MWGALAGLAIQGYSMWQEKEAAEQNQKDYSRQLRVTKKLAAEQLAITYNSIAQKSLEVETEFKRREFGIRAEQRAKSGQVTAQAAVTGATGNRAQLAQHRQAVVPGERELASLSADAKRAQDALIRRADMEERAMINRLITNTPDAPDQFDSFSGVVNLISSSISTYDQFKQRSAARNEAIVGTT